MHAFQAASCDKDADECSPKPGAHAPDDPSAAEKPSDTPDLPANSSVNATTSQSDAESSHPPDDPKPKQDSTSDEVVTKKVKTE